jgi:V8-like Glu-specific endopeptidase
MTFAASQAFALTTRQPYVVYGNDDRVDVYAEARADLREVADSTVAMIPNSAIKKGANGMLDLSTAIYGQESSLCQDEPFYNQPTAAMCSGALIGDDTLITAGHCISAAECSSNSFVFGFRMQDEKTAVTSIPSDEVYKCKQVIARELTSSQDYAIVKLDRPVKSHRVLPMSQTPAAVGDAVYVVGHPMGLPTKIAGGANVRAQNTGYFVANLDTYGGNSGSGVFNEKNEVVGILVRGDRDMVYDYGNRCYRSNVNSNTGGRGEDVTNISYVIKALQQ